MATEATVRDRRTEIELPIGTLRYREAGEGPPLVFVHGFLVDGRLWEGVVDRLADRFRCLVPDWPFGAHRLPMKPGADLSPPGVAAAIAGFLDALELQAPTLVGNDSGGAMSQIFASLHRRRLGRLVLTNCDTHENFPPREFRALPHLAKLPGAIPAMSMPFRVPALARRAYRPFVRRPIPAELIASWVEPVATSRGVRRDIAKLTAGMRNRHTLAAAEALAGDELPLLLAWAPDDRYFPISYAERLAAEMPNARLVPIEDSKTFVPLDRPERLAEEIASFAG